MVNTRWTVAVSKFYWKLKASGAFKPMKYQITYIVTNLNRKRTKLISGRLKTYPSNKWGHGYWSNKWK